MASIWKHPNSPYWTACFTDLDGRRKKRSTKETNRRKAEKLAEQFEEAARKRRTFGQVRSVLQDLHREITGEELKSVTVREHVQSWLAEKKDETKLATMHFYKASTTKFLDFLGERSDQEISLVTRGDLIGYRKALASTLSSNSTNHHIKCARMMFKMARRDALIAENPAEFVERVKKKGGYERRPFTEEEIRRVLAEADDEWRSMILFALYTGQRLSDVAAFTWAQVNLEKAEIRFETAKTGRRMLIPIAAPLLTNLKSIRKKDKGAGPIHPRAAATLNKNYKTSTLSNQFANLLAAAGLRNKVSHKKEKDGRAGAKTGAQLSFHSLRHTAVTLLKEAGVPHAVVQELIGHDSEQMSEHYTHVGIEALKKAAAALADVTSTRS
jgi:integrase